LVLGNEKSGIDKFFLASSSIAFYIPIFGSNNSMNVSISAAVAGYTLKRQTSANESPHLR